MEKTKNYRDVVSLQLISDWTVDQNGKRTVTVSDATKARFKAVLHLLAGRAVDPTLRSTLPNAEKVHPALPEDLVLIAFSSHGYADQFGAFYLYPYDIGSEPGDKVGPELLRRAISSDELSTWMREIDAGEMVMVIDACHSAASVEGTGFKPGPMGARGLGQLAYDKGMRILASTRADDVALESALTKQGLLSYPLVEDGLNVKRADFDSIDKQILLPAATR